jgi:glyoxylase-like metal-dependent hydrolase (beta-lactamase superfamily II)
MAVSLQVISVVSKPFEQNSYLVRRADHTDCFVVDPGFEAEKLLERIRTANLRVTAILITHGHVDHIAGNAELKETFPEAPLIIGAGDARMLSDPLLNLSALTGDERTSPPADLLVHDEQIVEVNGLAWLVRELPGHSPGHVVFIWSDGSPPIVFSGDVLMAGAVGRVDFPGGDGIALLRGIRDVLYRLPAETIVYPGHGPPTSIGVEMASNPFTRRGHELL